MSDLAPRLGQLIRLLLGTDKSGEIVAAAALKRTLTTAGLDHFALANAVEIGLRTMPEPEPEPDPWQRMAQWCHERRDRLTKTDADFVANIMKRVVAPSPRQRRWLDDIVNKLQERAA
jgi:hypothetical protein